jgi:hypothetical protein
MKRPICLFTLAFALTAPVAPLRQAWAATPGDYDGDGIADLAIIDADAEEDKTTVFVRMSSDDSETGFVFFPFGDWVISGDFFGNGRTRPGIVNSSRKRRQLEWRIKKPDGGEKVFKFGARKDVVPNQGDLDCDGTTDYVVVHKAAGTRVWQAKLSSAPTKVQTTVFGGPQDYVFTADVDGDGCSEIGALTPQYVWSTRPFAGETKTEAQWGRSKDIPLLPADLDGDGVPEYITVRADKKKLTARIHNTVGGVDTTKRLGTAAAIPMVGKFYGPNTFAWFVPSEGRFYLINAESSVVQVNFGNPRRGVVRPDGSAVPEGQSGKFGR